MLKVFAVPLAIRTPAGRVLARFAVPPEAAGEPWWVIYRAENGGWFTAMLPHPEPTG